MGIWGERIFGAIIIGILLTTVAILLVAVYDGRERRLAEPKVISCRLQQMDAIRLTYTDSVVCVPFATRRDTLGIEAVK